MANVRGRRAAGSWRRYLRINLRVAMVATLAVGGYLGGLFNVHLSNAARSRQSRRSVAS